MVPSRRVLALLPTLALAASAAWAGEASRFARWHFEFGRGLEISILFLRTEEGDDTRLLVTAPAGRFELVSRQDPSGNDSTESVRSVATGEMLERRILLRGGETVEGCEGVHHPDACLLWKGVNGGAATGMSEFSGGAASATRQKVAALVSPPFREKLFALAEVLPIMAEFGSYTSDFLALVWPETFNVRQALRRGKRGPGCDFDTAFGYPCTPAEREREGKRFPDGR